MKKILNGAGVLLALTLMSLSPAEPKAETEPYMSVHRDMPEQHEVNVMLYGTNQHENGTTKLTTNREDKDSEYTENEILLMERVVMSESSIEPFEGKVAVAKTILNRSKLYGMSIEKVIYTPYQYSFADNGKPTEEVKMAVTKAINDTEYPTDMIYFREGGYHSFGTPYKQIGKHYFSLSE